MMNTTHLYETARLKRCLNECINYLNTSYPREASHYPAEAQQQSENPLPSKAAVLIPFIIEDGVFKILYTLRNPEIAMYPGEISFPGGKAAKDDSSIVDTALREMEEEIGLSHDCMEIIGLVDTMKTLKRGRYYTEVPKEMYQVSCVIGLVKGKFSLEQLKVNTDEVIAVFTCPVQDLLQNVGHIEFNNIFVPKCNVSIHEKEYYIYGFTYQLSLLFCQIFNMFPAEKKKVFIETISKSDDLLSPKMQDIFHYCIEKGSMKQAIANSNL